MNSKYLRISAGLLFSAGLFFSCASKAPVTPQNTTVPVAETTTESFPQDSSDPNTSSCSEPALLPVIDESTAILKHKGSGTGVNIMPAWFSAYVDGGTEAIESLPDFQLFRCFVVEAVSDQLDEAYALAQTEKPSEAVRDTALWWMQVRRYADDGSHEFHDAYHVYILYTLPKDSSQH